MLLEQGGFFMWRQLRNSHFCLMIAGDALLFFLALVGAYLVRFEFEISASDMKQIKMLLPFLIPFKLLVFYHFGLYRGMWRYTSMSDLWRLFQASLVAILVTVAIVFYVLGTQGFSRAVFFLDGTFTFLLTGAYRAGIRFYCSLKGRVARRGIARGRRPPPQ